MAVTAEDVIKAFEKAKAASADAEGNTASEDRCVDVLGALAKMPIPLKMFVTGALGEVPKGIKKWAKKGPTDKIRAAAESCVGGAARAHRAARRAAWGGSCRGARGR